ncbi:hypothetical protein GGI11_007806 [Coemansia sp. RSA 2049]|nr:hypothetical protein GGI11_007806 [Coemansia sp. RSA 2049]KAJ2589544.1 hypothetical protein EV177_009220 [Coemansia sp. RSA 1804]
MSSATARRRKPDAQQPPPSSSAETPSSSSRKENSSPRDAAATAGPSALILISILISFISTAIIVASLIRMGPQILEPVYGNILPHSGCSSATVTSLAIGAAIGLVYWRHIVSVATIGSVSASGSEADQLTTDTRTARASAIAFDVTAAITALAPQRAEYVFRWSGRLGPKWGPFVSHSALVYPVFMLGGFTAAVCAARVSYNPRSPTRQWTVFGACLAAASLATWVVLQLPIQHRTCHGLLLNAGYAALSSLMIKLLAGRQEDLDAADALDRARRHDQQQTQHSKQKNAYLGESRLRRLRFVPTAAFVLFAATTLLSDPLCASGLAARSSASTPGYAMLSRAESVTGWVSVSDDTTRRLRVLRSGHSIIGGHWNSTGESIFAIFYYADAVRLVRGRSSSPKARQTLAGDGTERALQIGLGIGVSARSLHEQNVRVDVVEIDPAVYRAAVDFFMLPTNLNAVHLADGRRFIDTAQTHTYDYVVHDVFTGGSVPAPLFSTSAIEQIRRILKPDGILAMNYVGIPNDSRSLAHITFTLRTAFPHIRCFAETLEDPDAMVNMMFFASPRPVRFDITPGLLRAIGSSSIRARALQDMEKNEVDIDAAVSRLDRVKPITDTWNPLPQWQAGPAIQHWHAMRNLFPENYWLNY